ncbi:formyltransferase family protein [Francisella philomiragia]|uniref:formyltransferase family protein n=1 Tax=Francisella philomiragia TaxID=28110 RepID=UPI00190676DC|nr:formyltransferase family protein [Francisella philomiragia]MBK2026301.1 methionyl-tRNA formyltransferase [Francisella philomiragia]
MNNKVAFYVMNSKGYYTLEKFIDRFGAQSIQFVISSKDKSMQNDFYQETESLTKANDIAFYNKSDDYEFIESNFTGYKFAIGWRWIIRNDKNLIVFHDSLLPKYRGFAPLVNCLVNNESQSGVTALFANSEYDKGDIIAQKKIDIKYPVKISDMIRRVEPLYYELVEEVFISIKNNETLISIKQDESKSTYSLWLDDEDYFIDWSWSSTQIKRFVDAVGYPYGNAKTYLDNKIIKVINAEIVEDVYIENRDRHIGKIIFYDDHPIVICKNGLIAFKDLVCEDLKKIKIKFRSRFY